MTEQIVRLTCLRCEYEWWPNSPERPKVCPNCKSRLWDTPRGDPDGARKRVGSP